MPVLNNRRWVCLYVLLCCADFAKNKWGDTLLIVQFSLNLSILLQPQENAALWPTINEANQWAVPQANSTEFSWVLLDPILRIIILICSFYPQRPSVPLIGPGLWLSICALGKQPQLSRCGQTKSVLVFSSQRRCSYTISPCFPVTSSIGKTKSKS